VDRLRTAEAQYKIECQQREAEAEARNQELDKLISNLAFDVESAIHEYVGIVLSNSAYPDPFPVSHDHEFDLSSRELRLTVTVPQPSDVPAVKEYRYVKAKDEITRRCCRSKPGRPVRRSGSPGRGPHAARDLRSRSRRQDPLDRTHARHGSPVASHRIVRRYPAGDRGR
jgi:hypothetical protein